MLNTSNMVRKSRHSSWYYNDICVYDIETTPFKFGSIVYSHAFNLNGETTVLRHMSEFVEYIKNLQKKYKTDHDHRLVIYIHNLAFDFEFIRTQFKWDEIFTIGESQQYVKAVTGGIEFRCSLKLTGMSLDKLGSDYGLPKLDLDYSIIRHPNTPLTKTELGYIERDVDLLYKVIKDKLRDDNMATIPMTKTGYVRRLTRKNVNQSKVDMNKISPITMTTENYYDLKQVFQGGYVHANPHLSGTVVENVAAADLGSSYPSSVCQFPYPMSSFTELPNPTIEDVELYSQTQACLIDATFEYYECSYPAPPISKSKCIEISSTAQLDNGRVVNARKLRIKMTEVDYEIYKRCSTWTNMTVHSLHTAKMELLPKSIIETVLNLYSDKTTLKGNSEMEFEYNMAKAMINSVYGMFASDPIHATTYNDYEGLVYVEEETSDTIEKKINKYNSKRGRFSSFAWGAWVTAYSRSILLHVIYDLCDNGVEFVYCDTDSIYYKDNEIAMDIFNYSNEQIISRIDSVLKHYNINPELARPKNRKGETFQLGEWEDDTNGCNYEKFKSLGAKRYICEKKGELSLTASGLSKKKALDYIKSIGGIDAFDSGLHVPAGHSGKNVVRKYHQKIEGMMTDYLGNEMYVEQDGFVTINESEYNLTVGDDYSSFLEALQRLDGNRIA